MALPALPAENTPTSQPLTLRSYSFVRLSSLLTSAAMRAIVFISLLPPEELKALWRRLVQLAAPDQSRFVRRVAEITKGVAAVTGLLERLAGLLRQAVHVVGWLVLLWGAAVLPFQGHPSPEHLVVPGAGLLAVLQGAVPAWLHRHLLRSTVASPSHEPGLRTGESGVEGDTPESGSGDVAFDGVMEDVERIPQV